MGARFRPAPSEGLLVGLLVGACNEQCALDKRCIWAGRVLVWVHCG